MNILNELTTLFDTLRIPAETIEFTETPQPETFAVFTPIDDNLALFADDEPHMEIQSVRISVFTKHNYLQLIKNIKKSLLADGFTISDSRKVAYESDTKYHHYAIDVEKDYLF